MAITYPLSLPDVKGMNRFSLSMSSVNAIVRSSFTLKEQVQTHQGQIWRASLGFPPRNHADFAEWKAFLTKLNGMQGTFLLGDPLGDVPRGGVPGIPLVNGAAQTGQTLITDGWGLNQTGVLLAGDYIQLGSGTSTRLYEVLNDVDSDGVGTGEATIDIWPRLRESPSNNEAIVTSSPKGTFRLSSNDQGWEERNSGYYTISFSAVEAF